MAGEIFKKKREELGIDIKEASDILKIGPEYLSAIENDLFDKLPVAVYTIGYIRCYAKYLDVDAGPVITNFTSHLSSPKPSTIIPVASSRRKVPGYIYGAAALLAGLFVVVVVYTYISKNRTVDLSVENIRGPVKEEKPAPLNAAPESYRTSKGNVAIKSRQAVAGRLPDDKREHRLSMIASDTVWLQMKYENGKTEELLLRPGMSKDLNFSGSVVLKIGNAGGVALKFDGKDLGVPGKPGQVLKLNFPPA